MVKGQVTISIEDFQTLLDASVKAAEVKLSTQRASKEIQIFLSFIHNQLELTEHIASFNRQSKSSEIIIDDDNRIKIKLKDD